MAGAGHQNFSLQFKKKNLEQLETLKRKELRGSGKK